MKKEVTYYLEDPKRLKEISQTELDNWISEMPFHQPLHMLSGMKAEMEGHRTDDGHKVYAAYFAEDYESSKRKPSKNNNQRNKNTKQLATTIDIQSKKDIEIEKNDLKKEVINSPDQIVQKLVNDPIKDSENKEELEEVIDSPGKAQITSELANDLFEEEIITEVLEENITIVSPSITEEEELNLEKEIAKDKEDDIEAVIIDDALEDNSKPTTSTVKQSDKDIKIDYSKYTKIVDIESYGDEKTPSRKKKSANKRKNKSIAHKNLTGKKKEKPKKKEKKSKKKEVKDKVLKQKEKSKKKKKKEKKAEKIEKSEVKGLVGKVQKHKKKAKEKKVKYIIVDSSKKENFKLNDYDGVSNYTSWLLEQESINNNSEGKNNPQFEMKKSKKKSKKKKKKSKSLKIAIDSIKEQDSIISEPLADILAQQGHKKKARKMFSKLALLFPEKKEHFEAKIESLKN